MQHNDVFSASNLRAVRRSLFQVKCTISLSCGMNWIVKLTNIDAFYDVNDHDNNNSLYVMYTIDCRLNTAEMDGYTSTFALSYVPRL